MLRKWRYKQDRQKPTPHSDVVVLYRQFETKPSANDFVITAETKQKSTAGSFKPIVKAIAGKNIVGRVGRAGKETRGRIVFANNSDRSTVIEVLREIRLEPALGRLYRLIETIERHFREHRIPLTNEVLEQQQPWFLALVDSIDHAIIDLVPEATSSEQILASIDELIDHTLAQHQSQSAAIKKTLHDVFRLRGTSIRNTVSREAWPALKRSGASPRFWKAVNDAGLLDLSIWQTLDQPTDHAWRDEVVLPVLALTAGASQISAPFLVEVVDGWLSGRTYAEIAQASKRDVESILSAICEEIGFRLQDSVSKVIQLAQAKHGEDKISEIAQAWPSFLQFGLGTLQQLDLCERGTTDRLAVWGIQRFLSAERVEFRGSSLVLYLRQNAQIVKETLATDNRVPQLCAARVCRELRIR